MKATVSDRRRRYLERRPQFMVCLEITDLTPINSGQVEVELKTTGLKVLLPTRAIEIYPGRVYLPAWLAKRLGRHVSSAFE